MDALQELKVWRRNKGPAVKMYALLSDCKDLGFKDQITGAAVSIPSNIAEGYGRNSKKDFAHYLRIAKVSCAEVRTQIEIGMEIGHIPRDNADHLLGEYLQLSMMLQGLINHCRNNIRI